MVTLKLLWPGSTSYLLGQYVGSFIIIVGAVLSVLPQLIHPVEAIGLADNRWTALLTYTGGVIFYSFGTIYKAHALKHAPLIDYWYVSFVENAWNFVLGFLFLPLLWIPGMSQAESPTASWPNFQGGYTCFFHGYSPMDPNATCGQLWWISILWIASNIWVNVLGLVVCRLGDSVIFNVVNSVQLPLTNLCLASSFLMTTALVSPFSPMMGFAVGCTFVGFGIYSFLPMQKGPEEGKGEEKEADASEEGRKATSAKGGGGGRGGTKSIQHGEGANRLTSPLISEY
jgi:hypothetical protein